MPVLAVAIGLSVMGSLGGLIVASLLLLLRDSIRQHLVPVQALLGCPGHAEVDDLGQRDAVGSGYEDVRRLEYGPDGRVQRPGFGRRSAGRRKEGEAAPDDQS